MTGPGIMKVDCEGLLQANSSQKSRSDMIMQFLKEDTFEDDVRDDSATKQETRKKIACSQNSSELMQSVMNSSHSTNNEREESPPEIPTQHANNFLKHGDVSSEEVSGAHFSCQQKNPNERKDHSKSCAREESANPESSQVGTITQSLVAEKLEYSMEKVTYLLNLLDKSPEITPSKQSSDDCAQLKDSACSNLSDPKEPAISPKLDLQQQIDDVMTKASRISEILERRSGSGELQDEVPVAEKLTAAEHSDAKEMESKTEGAHIGKSSAEEDQQNKTEASAQLHDTGQSGKETDTPQYNESETDRLRAHEKMFQTHNSEKKSESAKIESLTSQHPVERQQKKRGGQVEAIRSSKASFEPIDMSNSQNAAYLNLRSNTFPLPTLAAVKRISSLPSYLVGEGTTCSESQKCASKTSGTVEKVQNNTASDRLSASQDRNGSQHRDEFKNISNYIKNDISDTLNKAENNPQANKNQAEKRESFISESNSSLKLNKNTFSSTATSDSLIESHEKKSTLKRRTMKLAKFKFKGFMKRKDNDSDDDSSFLPAAISYESSSEDEGGEDDDDDHKKSVSLRKRTMKFAKSRFRFKGTAVEQKKSDDSNDLNDTEAVPSARLGPHFHMRVRGTKKTKTSNLKQPLSEVDDKTPSSEEHNEGHGTQAWQSISAVRGKEPALEEQNKEHRPEEELNEKLVICDPTEKGIENRTLTEIPGGDVEVQWNLGASTECTASNEKQHNADITINKGGFKPPEANKLCADTNNFEREECREHAVAGKSASDIGVEFDNNEPKNRKQGEDERGESTPNKNRSSTDDILKTCAVRQETVGNVRKDSEIRGLNRENSFKTDKDAVCSAVDGNVEVQWNFGASTQYTPSNEKRHNADLTLNNRELKPPEANKLVVDTNNFESEECRDNAVVAGKSASDIGVEFDDKDPKNRKQGEDKRGESSPYKKRLSTDEILKNCAIGQETVGNVRKVSEIKETNRENSFKKDKDADCSLKEREDLPIECFGENQPIKDNKNYPNAETKEESKSDHVNNDSTSEGETSDKTSLEKSKEVIKPCEKDKGFSATEMVLKCLDPTYGDPMYDDPTYHEREASTKNNTRKNTPIPKKTISTTPDETVFEGEFAHKIGEKTNILPEDKNNNVANTVEKTERSIADTEDLKLQRGSTRKRNRKKRPTTLVLAGIDRLEVAIKKESRQDPAKALDLQKTPEVQGVERKEKKIREEEKTHSKFSRLKSVFGSGKNRETKVEDSKINIRGTKDGRTKIEKRRKWIIRKRKKSPHHEQKSVSVPVLSLSDRSDRSVPAEAIESKIDTALERVSMLVTHMNTQKEISEDLGDWDTVSRRINSSLMKAQMLADKLDFDESEGYF